MTCRKLWGKQMRMKIDLKYLLVQKVVKKPTNYLTGYQQAEMLKCLLATLPGVPILRCSGINTVLNGWWNLTQNPMDKMVEVFKTDVQKKTQSKMLLCVLSKAFPSCKINFDLSD